MLIVRNPSFPNECIYFQNGSTYWKRGASVFKFVSVEFGQVFFPVCSKFTVISNVSPSSGNVTLFFKGNYRHCAEKKNKTISQCRIETCQPGKSRQTLQSPNTELIFDVVTVVVVEAVNMHH